MARTSFSPLRSWRTLVSPRASNAGSAPVGELKAAYVAHVDALKQALPHDQAMELAIGGGFERIGEIEVGILRHFGLGADDSLIDVGCGSGRLARPLAGYLKGRYLGLDLVPDLVAHARKVAARPDWRFEVIDHIGIPAPDGQADMVCFFSVLTHLRHEQSFWYLQEAHRVLKPGGQAVFSFLEFREPGHMPIFWATLQAEKSRSAAPMNVFIERNVIQVWADALAMELIAIRDAGDPITPLGELGQSVCVLRKPLAA